ncbi:MAG TPA: carboxypeptidase regulatory-like domain-containing protein [Candidatus Dormibacteraeota bacterium]|nr:carboxypeptidase regulatory-like domain-containing protein [Candidatus Dormibacteraeota bacterium]
MSLVRGKWIAAVLLTLLPVLSGSRVRAQYTTGSAQGTIYDPNGVVVAGAAVTLQNLDTNALRTLRTGSDGIYLFPALPPGRYEVSAEVPHLARAEARFSVTSSQTVTQNLKLTLQGQRTTVTVQAGTLAELNTSNPQLSTTRDALEINNLPIGRTVFQLVALEPGVQPMYSPSGGLVKVSGAQTGPISANGGRPESTNVELDFTDANDWEFGGFALGTEPAPDMLQEFKVLTSNVPAEYGVESSAQVEMVTRSGTNDWHGDAYDFLQNNDFNARDYFDQTGHATRINQNNYGFAMGGPLVRNRTFLFGGWEQLKTRGGGFTDLAEVPTALARSQATDPAIISLMQQFIPGTKTIVPNTNGMVGTVSQQFSAPANSYQFILRGDHRFSRSNTLSIRYFQSTGTFVLPFPQFNTLAGFDANLHYEARNANISDTWVVSPVTVNQLRLGYARSLGLLPPQNNLQSPRFIIAGVVSFGALQFFTQGRTFNVYQLNDVLSHVAGRHQLKFGFDARYIQDNSVNQTNDRGVFVFASQPGAGAFDSFLNGQPSVWTQAFGPTELGFRTGLYSTFVQDDYRVCPTLTVDLGLRWQYQASLREAHGLLSILDPALSGTIGQAGSGALGAFKIGNPGVGANPFNFGPRLGFAWNPHAGPLVVRGGYGVYYDSFKFTSLAEARTNPPLNYTFALTGSTAISGQNSFDSLLAGTAAIQSSAQSQIGSFGSLGNFGAISTVNPRMRNPYMQEWDLVLDYRLPASMLASVGYVGSKGTHLELMTPINPIAPASRPAPATSLADEQARIAQFEAAQSAENGAGNNRVDPRFNQVNEITDAAYSNFNALQLNLQKAISFGLMFQASYTWSKSLDNSSSSNPIQEYLDPGFPQNASNLKKEYAVSNFDVPQRFVLTTVWKLPFFRNRSGWLSNLLLKDWQFSTVNTWQSGIPGNIYAGSIAGLPGQTTPIVDVNMDGNFLPSGADNTRANCGSGPGFQLGHPASVASQARFSEPLLGNNGTCGRNIFRLNSLFNSNWAFSKLFQLKEAGALNSGPWDLEFRAEMYNIFNTPYLTINGPSQLTLGNPTFGLYNSAGATRRITLALRLLW